MEMANCGGVEGCSTLRAPSTPVSGAMRLTALKLVVAALLLLDPEHRADAAGPGPPSPRKRPSKGLRPTTRLVVEMPVMVGCPDVPNNAIRFSNMSVALAGKNDFVLNGEYDILREATDIAEVVIGFTKCREHQSANTCENFQTWRFNRGVCHLMYKPNTLWSKFHDYVTPRPTCPNKAGKYQIRNATLDMKAMQALPLPLEGNVWIIKFSQFEPNGKLHTCTDTELRFHRAREN